MEQSPTAEELLGKIEELQAGHARLREEMTRMRTSDARQMAYSASPSRYRFPVAQRREACAGTGQEGTVSLEKSSGSCCHSRPLQQESCGDDSVNSEGTVGGKGDGEDDAGGSCVSGPSVLNFSNGRHMNILQSMGQSLHKIITDKAETWIGKTGLTRPWKGNEQKSPELCSNRIPWPQLPNDQETDVVLKNLYAGAKPKSLVGDSDMSGENEAPGSWSSSCNVSGTTSASSCGSSSTSALNKVEMETDCLDNEILWEDLAIGEQIGQGSCGTVYHGLWYGSNVAIKAFSGQEYTDDVIHSFKQEVSLMKRLRHPNLLLFMGAVTSPERLCIVTEFLPRGSLFQLLQKNAPKLDWRRRVHIALDVARGLNYLHHFNPPIVHGDLKSSNLLVDKNWTVKVGDFGLSRLKRETYLSVKDGKGTPQWMAPEILRNEPSDEKSDVYSFGVVLWEICTEKIPWDNLNSMQVIGAVGFMNQRLEIPEVMDPEWASIIESCWHSDPWRRPAFEKLLERLKDLRRRYGTQLQAARPTSVATAQN